MSLSWDEYYRELCVAVAAKSKDRTHPVGAVIVDRHGVVATGYNGFPRGVDDDVDARHEKPIKLLWTEHAECNAIYAAAARGTALHGSRIYCSWYPCAGCARGIIQAGIKLLYSTTPDFCYPVWGPEFVVANEMLNAAGVGQCWEE